MDMVGRSGYWKNNLFGDAAYRSFVPMPLPPEPVLTLDQENINLLIVAHKRLALLDGLISRIPSVSLFISIFIRKEALMSSQIEGTQATLEDILDPLAEDNANRNVADVINYIKAVEYAIDRLKELPLCNRLLREIHAILIENARGHEWTPGEFRRSQNWIGGQGSTLKTARYVPPNPEDMQDAMNKLENYINNNYTSGDLDVLVRVALIHYQFETIHPFLDGNGRIGRLLVTLFLMEKKVISAPALYISYALKRNRAEYYDRMALVREKGDYEQWVSFFVSAILEAADDAVMAADKLIALHEKNFALIQKIGRSAKTAGKVFFYLTENPIIEIQKTSEALGLSYNAVASVVRVMCGIGVLKQVNEAIHRNRTFVYEDYLAVLRNGT
jgi:Fic family protein